MTDIQLTSLGFSVGRWRFPAFTLKRGECLTLRFPAGAVSHQEDVLAALENKKSIPGLKLYTSILLAQPVSGPSRWGHWFDNTTPLLWLKKNTKLSEEAIRSFLGEHRIDERIPLRHCGGTPRALLGLKAVLARKPGVVVFWTAGLDPTGVLDVFQMVTDHLSDSAAIYLAWPFLSEGMEQYHQFSGSAEVTVLDEHQPMTTVLDRLR